jgi:hypothetical protein
VTALQRWDGADAPGPFPPARRRLFGPACSGLRRLSGSGRRRLRRVDSGTAHRRQPRPARAARTRKRQRTGRPSRRVLGPRGARGVGSRNPDPGRR